MPIIEPTNLVVRVDVINPQARVHGRIASAPTTAVVESVNLVVGIDKIDPHISTGALTRAPTYLAATEISLGIS